jgi:hypothetical protein
VLLSHLFKCLFSFLRKVVQKDLQPYASRIEQDSAHRKQSQIVFLQVLESRLGQRNYALNVQSWVYCTYSHCLYLLLVPINRHMHQVFANIE